MFDTDALGEPCHSGRFIGRKDHPGESAFGVSKAKNTTFLSASFKCNPMTQELFCKVCMRPKQKVNPQQMIRWKLLHPLPTKICESTVEPKLVLLTAHWRRVTCYGHRLTHMNVTEPVCMVHYVPYCRKCYGKCLFAVFYSAVN